MPDEGPLGTFAPAGRSWALLAAVVLATLLVPSHGIAAASGAQRGCGWRIVHSPNPGGSAILYGVSSFPHDTAWAVGVTHPVYKPRTLALHDTGSGWTQVPTPNPDPVSNRLDAVDGLADDDVWAVGSRQGGEDGTLVEHWDGSAWSVVPSPNPPQPFSWLNAVSVASSTDVWAVGATQDLSGMFETTLIEHWDGRTWTIVPSPNPGRINNLFGVSAVSSADAWAVGNASDRAGVNHNLVLHWDGEAWTVVAAPSPGLKDNVLSSITSLGADEAWAVGYAADSTQEGAKSPVTLHWDGRRWIRVRNPHLSAQLNSVAAGPNGELWAAGYRETPPTPLIERRVGSSWRVVRAQNQQGAVAQYLNGMAIGASSASGWAVGSGVSREGQWHTLVERPCAATA